MGRPEKNRRKPGARPPSAEEAGSRKVPRILAVLAARCHSWFKAKNPIFAFVLVFGALLALFYGLTLTPLFKKTLFPGYLRLNAVVSSAILSGLGQGTSISGTGISSARCTIDIRRGCDAVEPTALFVAAVLAFPAAFRRKISGVLAGMVLLALLNLVRIISLFLVGVYFPKAFELMHGDVWQALFILLSILLWALWIQWAMKPRLAPATSHVPA
jgi:exosortase H (IPTLxxWG-CTERM-specific)